MAAGKAQKIEESTEAERILKELMLSIDHAPKNLIERSADAEGSERGKPLRAADWILAIEAMVASIKTRRSGLPGARDYLNFAQEFVAQAKGS